MSPLRRRFVFAPVRALALGLLFFGLASCSDGTGPASPDASAPAPDVSATDDALLGIRLLGCSPLQAAHSEALIGPAGGTLTVGPHTFTVPAGALATTVRITADIPPDSVNSVVFGPAGLTFAADHPARLTLSYANCGLVNSLLGHRVAYTSDALKILEVLTSSDDLLHRQVSADVGHFSRYAVAW